MVRQKSSKKQRKSLAGDAGMLFAIEECAARGHVRGHATVLHDNNTEGKGPVLTTWSEEESLPWNLVDRHSFGKKITPGMSDSFETWQEYFWTIDASFKRKKED